MMTYFYDNEFKCLYFFGNRKHYNCIFTCFCILPYYLSIRISSA